MADRWRVPFLRDGHACMNVDDRVDEFHRVGTSGTNAKEWRDAPG